MHIRSQQLNARGVTMDIKSSWATQEYDSTFPNLENMARFQQKQLQEKEQKLLQLYDQQQQRAYQVAQRSSAGSNGSNHGSTAVRTSTTTTTATHTTSTSQGGKVRQMFDERRQTTVKGIDRSYPLEPLENKVRKQTNTNGNVTVNRQSVKRVSRADVNSNVNGGKPVVSYHEEIIRESFGPGVRRQDDEDEYGVENRVATFANGHYRQEIDNEQEEPLDQEMIERNRMMAKIHLMGFDETLKHRVRNDLESEEFPEYLMADVPDKLSKRNVTKKLSQAEERLERFKNANAKRSNMTKQSTATNAAMRKRSEQVIPAKSNSRLWGEIAGTSPTSARSGSSRTSERSQRILENAKSFLPARVVDEISVRRREGSDTETLGQRTSPRSFATRDATKTDTTLRIYPMFNEFKSLTSDGKIFVRRSLSPQFFSRKPERSKVITSTDRRTKSPLFHRETFSSLMKRSRNPPFFLNKSRRPSESKSPVWSDRGISSWQSTSPQYLNLESKRSETATTRATSTDREPGRSNWSEWSKGSDKRDTIEWKKVRTSTSLDRKSSPFKSQLYEEETLKRRNSSPQFFCKESERSATTMSIDRATSESKSPSYDREVVKKRSESPRFFLSESERSRGTSESKSPIWGERGVSARQSTSPPYLSREFKRSETATSTDRDTVGSKSTEWSKQYTSPRFFCKESERSGTTMSIDRKVGEPRSSSYDRKVLTKRSATPRLLNGKITQRSVTTTSVGRKYGGFKSPGLARDKRSTSPQFFCKESERSATTMLIEPRSRSADSTKSTSRQRNYDSDTSYGRSVKSPIDKKVRISSTKGRYTPSPWVTRHEVGKADRRSSKISETSATSSSSIVNLKYGLEFDNIFQSAGLVRKFMKSQNGKQRAIHQSPWKRNIKDVSARVSPRGNQSKNRRKTLPPFQIARSPPVEGRRRATPEFPRKSITPTETDMDIQEITMTDHRIERDKLQKASSPMTRRQFDETYAKSSSNGAKFKTSIIYPVRKTHRKGSILESVFRSKGSSVESGAGSSRTTSPDFSKVRKYPGTPSPILYDFAKRTKGTRTEFSPPQSVRSARLVQGTVKDKTADEYNKRGGDEGKNVAVDEFDAGIGIKYQAVVKTALSKGNKNYREIVRPNSADRNANRRVFLRETTQKPVKSSTSKRTISPTRDCGRRHDVKSRISPRVSPLRKTAEISRVTYTPKIFSSQSIVSKADRYSAESPTSKFPSRTAKDRRRESVLVAKKLAESFNKMNVKRRIAKSTEDTAREISKVRREDKSGKDLERMDSVESALKRFDSIGAEFEHSSLRKSPEISLQTMDVQKKTFNRETIGAEGIVPFSREITADYKMLRATLKSPIGKDPRAKRAARNLTSLQREIRSSRRPTRAGSFNESKQRSTKIRSPTCKRRLFESDSEREIREERPKSSCAKVRRDKNCSVVNLRFRKGEAVSNLRSSSKGLDRDVARISTPSEETPTFSTKPLRSIEDIRKSIDNNERGKLTATEESRSAIANQRPASRDGVDARRSSLAANAAKNVFLGADPARLTKIQSCVSRITKSPSPDPAATKQRETNARTTRGSAPSSPSKSPDVAPRRATTESRIQETKPLRRSAKGADSIGSKATATGAIDTVDGVVFQNGSPTESTRKSDAFVVDFDDRSSKEDDAITSKKSWMKKSSNDKQQTASSASGRSTRSSNSSVNLNQLDSSAKGRMAESERGKGLTKGGKSRGKGIEKTSSNNGRLANASSFNEDATNDTKGLVKCKTCGRSFAQNRIDLHEDICIKTTTKKRKQFDPVMSRVKGTELEAFVKKGFAKRESRTKKLDTKPDWRRKHEEFINTIRYARESQARLAAGGNLSDLPPPPASDTSDYVQCDHCGRKFNRAAAERHIPICKRMNDKKQTQAPRARR